MPPDTTWSLLLDRRSLQKAYTANSPLELGDCDVELVRNQCGSVDVAASVTEQSICVYFALSYTWGYYDKPSKSSPVRCTQLPPREQHSLSFTTVKPRPVRCHVSELRQCITWLVFQTLEDIATISLGQRIADDLSTPEGVYQREVEYALKLCRPDLIQHWLKTLYFAAVAVRCLDPGELFDVVEVVLAGSWQQEGSSQLNAPRTPNELLRIVAMLLVVDPAGKVRFRTHGMRDFLLRSRFLAQENGDECMARTCLGYLSEDNQSHVLKPWSRYSHNSMTARRPFFGYAASHWHRHYRAAESENNDLAAMLHQNIQREAMDLWGHQPLLHIEIQDLSLQMGLAVCTYYGLQVLTEIYRQMGTSGSGDDDCAVLVPFPPPLEHNLCFSKARMVRCGRGHDGNSCQMTKDTYDAPQLPSNATPNWVDSLTDGESSLDESWASLPARPPSEQWITDFDDLRLGYENHVFVHQESRKQFEDNWEVIDRKPDVGF